MDVQSRGRELEYPANRGCRHCIGQCLLVILHNVYAYLNDICEAWSTWNGCRSTDAWLLSLDYRTQQMLHCWYMRQAGGRKSATTGAVT